MINQTKTAIPVLLTAVLILVTPATHGADPVKGAVTLSPGGERAPVCESLSTTAPARLNVDASASLEDVLPPCKAAVDFYVPDHTPLRLLSGTVQYRDADRVERLASPFEVSLEGGGNGLLQGRALSEPIPGVMCYDLNVVVELSECLDQSGRNIDCPSVRAKGSYVFGELSVQGNGIDLCAD